MLIYVMSKITPKGYQDLLDKKQKLIEDLARYQKEMSDARSDGDLKENASYQISKEHIRTTHELLKAIEEKIASSVIIYNMEENSHIIGFNSRFSVVVNSEKNPSLNGEKIYQIVGESEANFFEGLIDEKSILGSSLMKKKVGDVVNIDNIFEVKIKEIL